MATTSCDVGIPAGMGLGVYPLGEARHLKRGYSADLPRADFRVGLELGISVKTYILVFQSPGALVSYTAAFFARLPIVMTPLSLLILVGSSTNSYAQGGLVTGAFALGRVISAPFWGCALDTGSHRRVVAVSATTSGAFLLLGWLGVQLQVSLFLLAGLTLCVGLSVPPIAPAMRVAWRRLVPNSPAVLAAAYAVDAVAVEAMFIIGPLISGSLYACSPSLPVIATCLFLVLGGLGYSLSPAGRTRGQKVTVTQYGDRKYRILMRRSLLLVGFVTIAMSMGLGQMDVALTSTAQATSNGGLVLGVRSPRLP